MNNINNMNNFERMADTDGENVPVQLFVSQFELTKALYTSGLLAQAGLTCSTKLFLWALCTHYNPKNKTMFPSQATVAKKLGISEKSAERAVKELKDKGFVDYETKRVNHYRFSKKFFDMVKMSVVADKNGDKLSEDIRQNVGCGVRQNVGLTNKKEQKNNKGFLNFQKGYYGKELQNGGKAVPSVEETKKLLEEKERIREEGFNPLDYSYEDAYRWIKSMPAFWLKRSKIARTLIEKYRFKEFLYTLEFDIENF